MQASARRANSYERGVLDLVEAVLLQDRVGASFPGMVVQRGRRAQHPGGCMIADPAVEAPVAVGRAPRCRWAATSTVRLSEADPTARRVRFTLV